jgi:hypothetical protein
MIPRPRCIYLKLEINDTVRLCTLEVEKSRNHHPTRLRSNRKLHQYQLRPKAETANKETYPGKKTLQCRRNPKQGRNPEILHRHRHQNGNQVHTPALLPYQPRRQSSHTRLSMVHQHTTMLRFYPHFSTFLTHVTSYALSFPCHLPMCTQHVPPSHGAYSRLHCTHMHYPLYPRSCLVPYGYAAASYYVPLTHSSMTHLSPFALYTFPSWYAS